MLPKVVLLCGAAATGKTNVITRLSRLLKEKEKVAGLCKIDCLHTDDHIAYQKTGFPYLVGISGDICPDHYLVSNLDELLDWSIQKQVDYLLVETAGLCNRCSPATEKMISICVVDGSASFQSPKKLGPMLSTADIVLVTKADMVSQAEREMIAFNIATINAGAVIFHVDAISGFGYGLLFRYLECLSAPDSYEDDVLRHTMPAAVCSYCVGERRIGTQYQQGIVEKMDLEGVYHV